MRIRRRDLLIGPAAGLLPGLWAAPALPRIGLVPSTYRGLRRTAAPDDRLDYEIVRDMVWNAIRLGRPRAGSLEAKIKPGSWVVVKPNIVALRPRPAYRVGDITDFRVTQAVVEYVARFSRAARVTVAEGGSYRRPGDKATDNVCWQNGVHVDARTFDWGADEFPGFGGSLQDMLAGMAAAFPGKKFDYVDLSYDAVRDAGGRYARLPVPVAPNGVGAYSHRADYFVTNTIRDCDFLISLPVMKVHMQCGITCCLKNYVGTAPREAYAPPGSFSNSNLHRDHSVEDRIDSFICDLAAFHPPDYAVVDAIRGLQYQEHGNGLPDQMIRSNLVFATEDPVAADALAARLMGFNEEDIEHLQMAEQRGMGTLRLDNADIAGADPVKLMRGWAKPRAWHGRGNRLWRLSQGWGTPDASWAPYIAPTDTLHLAPWANRPVPEGARFTAAATALADGHMNAWLWTGFQGKLRLRLNNETVFDLENRTRYRVGQYQYPIALRPGLNRFVCELEAVSTTPQLSLLVVTGQNNGDTPRQLHWRPT